MSRTHRAAGFTLIELLVAITLASLVAVLGALVLRAAMDFHGRASRHIKEAEDLRAADRLLAREWSGRRMEDLRASATGVEFQTDRFAGPYPAGEQSVTGVAYLCSRTDAGEVALERLVLARDETDQAGGGARRSGSAESGATSAWRVLRTEVLIPRLLACGFDYLQPREDSDARIAEWRADVAPGEPVPRLLRLTLVTGRGEIAPLVYGAQG